MIAVNTNYTNLRNNGANIEWRIVNGSNTFTVANLINGKLSTGLMENVSIGNCIAAELNLTLWGVTVDTSNPLVLQFRADGGTTWYTKGTYFVDTLDKSPYTEETNITAFDAMLKTEVGYMATNVWVNTTDLEVVNNIASDLGVAIDGNTFLDLDSNPIALTNAPHVGENGTTDREMLSYIAIMRGGNWIIDSNNSLRLIYPSNSPANTANVDLAVVNFAASETLTVSKVKVNVDSETYYLAPSNISEDAWKALAGYCIEVQLPFYGSQAVADALLTQYNGKSFVPYQSEGAYVDPKYEIGDGIRFQKDTTYYTTLIANQTINIGWLCPSDLYLKDEEKLDSLYPYLSPRERETLYQFGELQSAVEDAESAASAAQTAVGNANYKEQTIYISKASGTSSVSANTTWVTNTTGNQNTWTTTRPVYNSSYPVLFVATQRQSVTQSGGTTCTCTTPVIDQTTTVIDGGHITTGSIDAGRVTVGTLSGITINGNTISGNTITGGTISGTTITGSTLTSTSSDGSIKIADGEIDFYENATTTGTPFSRLEHVYNSSLGQHAIEWRTTGYTKLINEAGGQWTGDFIQFALNAQNPQLMFLIYPDSDGTYAKFNTDYVVVNGNAEFWGNVYLKSSGQIRGFLVDLGTGQTATIQVSRETINDKTNASRWILLNYSYNSTTGDRIGYYDAFALPHVDKNKTSNSIYNILTTKTANTLIWSGSLSTTGVQIGTNAYANCNAFVIQGRPSGTNKGKSTVTIPKGLVSSSEPTGSNITDYWSLADENNYINFCIWHSGDNLYMKKRDNNGSGIIETVYGLI